MPCLILVLTEIGDYLLLILSRQIPLSQEDRVTAPVVAKVEANRITGQQSSRKISRFSMPRTITCWRSPGRSSLACLGLGSVSAQRQKLVNN